MLWPVALDRKYTNYSVNNAAYQHIKSKALEYQTEYTQICDSALGKGTISLK